MTNDTNGSSKPNNGRVDASRGAVARKIGRLPPGEHLVELRARAMPGQALLRIAGYSPELSAGTVMSLDRLFGPQPGDSDARSKRAFAAQGSFWLSLLSACNLQDDELQDVTLAQLAERLSGRQVIAVINDAGFWSRVRSI
jgi:hypothetical protein